MVFLSLEVPNCRRLGETFSQVARGSLSCNWDWGRMFMFWSMIKLRGAYL